MRHRNTSPDSAMPEFIAMLRDFGFPVALLCVIGAGFWRALAWLAPRADRVVEAHLDFVGTLKADVNDIKVEVRGIRDEVGTLKGKIDALPRTGA